MTSEPDSTSESIPSWLEAAFLASYHSSAEPRELQTYQGEFPGYEDEVRALHEQVTAIDDTDASETYLGRYRLIGELGRGGQGVVYLAEDPDLKRQVAVKVLRDKDLFGSGRAGMRWTREQQLAARIDHPFVCPILEFGHEQDRMFSVYPYVRGHSLRQLISAACTLASDPTSQVDAGLRATADAIGLLARTATEPNGNREALERMLGFFSKLAEGVGAIHEHEIVHRDLKPANVLVRESGDPVILDLGLARDDSEDRLILTQEGDRLGTPAYMAPEQLDDQRATSPATDMWALGVIFYECLMLHRPFEGPTREALYRSILDASPDPVRLGGSYPERQLRVVTDTLLAKEPSRRYRGATNLAEDLRRIRAHEPILAKAPTLVERTFLWARRKPMLAMSLAGFVGSVIALVVILYLLVLEHERSSQNKLEKQVALRHMATEMLLDIQIELSKLSGTLPLRKRMFDKAMAYLEELENEQSRDAGLYRDLLEAHLGLGDVIGYPVNPNLGDPEQALEQFETALALTRELERDPPPGITAIEIQRFYARAHRKIASTLSALNRADEVESHFQAALTASRRVQADPAATLEDRERHMAILGQIASSCEQRGRHEAALHSWEEANRVSQGLVSEHPHDADIIANHAATVLIHSTIHEGNQDPERAVQVLLDFRGTLERAFAENPANTALSHYMFVFTSQAARLLLAIGREAEAFAEFERAMQLLSERQRREPDNEMAGRLGLKFMMQYSTALLQHGQADKALETAEAALARGRDLMRRFPHSAELRRGVGMICDYLEGYYAHAGRNEDSERIREVRAGVGRAGRGK